MIAALLSNTALAGRYLKMVTLVPLIIPLIDAAEAASFDGIPTANGEEKKAVVVKATAVAMDLLVKKGYILPEMNAGIAPIASDLIDIVVEVNNATGKFSHGKPPGQDAVVRKAHRVARHR